MAQVEEMTSPKLNSEQCNHLAAKLKLAIASATSFLELLSKGRFIPSPEEDKEIRLEENMRLLFALAMKVEDFIKSCCTDRWMQSAFTLTNVAEHVLSLSFDLELWTLLYSDIERAGACRSRRWTQEEVDSIFKTEAGTVDEKASLDREILLRDLDSMLHAPNSTNTELRLAAYVKDLLEGFGKSKTRCGKERLVAAKEVPKSSDSRLFETVIAIREIGKGGFGTVFKAKWLESELAMKTFPGRDNPDFEKEVSVLMGLSHPNIVSFMGYNADKPDTSIFMELLDKSLRRLMDERFPSGRSDRPPPFDLIEAVGIMLQIGEGMRYMREMGIVHRDLKSDNVLVRCLSKPEMAVELVVAAKVADFGLSKTKEKSTTYSNQTPNMGTPRWMAPEMIKSSGAGSEKEKAEGELMVQKYPFRSDIYSFAMVCYEILTGNEPFHGIRGQRTIKEKVLAGERPELPQGCPLPLKKLIERCWSQDASKRPRFCEICVELRHLKCSLLVPSILEQVSPPSNNPLQLSARHDSAEEVDGSAKASLAADSLVQPSTKHVNGEELESGSTSNKSGMGKCRYVVQPVPRKILGMEDHFKRLQSAIIGGHASQRSICVGIQGMGGAGKTLLAQMVNNDEEIHKVFGKTSICWITVGRDGSVPSIYVQMRNYLQVCTVSDGIALDDERTYLRNAFSSRRILLILDDVWGNVYEHKEMIEWLNIATGPGSVTLITTRTKSITSNYCGDMEVVLELSEEQSWELFCTHAFGTGAVPSNKPYLEEVARAVCKECKCLPLAVKVIGLAMKGKRDVADWRRTLRHLQDSTAVTRSVEEQLFGSLRISYDQLDEPTKICFLYFAAFPEDCAIPVDHLCQIWRAEGIFGEGLNGQEAGDEANWALNELKGLSLIEECNANDTGHDGKHVKMHDILRDLAIYITRQGDECARDSLFELNRKDLTRFPDCWLSLPLKVKRMSVWGNNIRRFPDNFHAPSLRICMLYPLPWEVAKWEKHEGECNIEEMFFQHMEGLRFFQLCNFVTLMRLPTTIGALRFLQHLDFSGCRALKELPESIGGLRSLQHLILTYCRGLTELPQSIRGLASLEYLSLKGCEALKELPLSIGGLTSLEYLSLKGCEALKELPLSIGGLTSLEYLSLKGCEALKELPLSIGGLTSLEYLSLKGCEALKELPLSIGGLGSLHYLDLHGCEALKELPLSIGGLESLHYLDLHGCEALKELPESIGGLKSLQHLNLIYCGLLKELPQSIEGLASLQHLDLTYCKAMKELPHSIGGLGSLQQLVLTYCVALMELPESIGRLASLQHLDLTYCGTLKELPQSIGGLGSLQQLDLYGCSTLKELPKSIGRLASLQHLNLTYCGTLKELPQSIEGLASLQHLDLTYCRAMKELPQSIGGLGSLQQLYLYGCTSLKELPQSIGRLASLQYLNLHGCKALKELPQSIRRLASLQYFDLSGCEALKELPQSIEILKSFQNLNVGGYVT